MLEERAFRIRKSRRKKSNRSLNKKFRLWRERVYEHRINLKAKKSHEDYLKKIKRVKG